MCRIAIALCGAISEIAELVIRVGQGEFKADSRQPYRILADISVQREMDGAIGEEILFQRVPEEWNS